MPRLSSTVYAGLADSVVAELKVAADKIRKLRRQEATSIIAIGCALLEAKDKLGHGRFGSWLESEFSLSQRTAENYMIVGAAFGDKIETVANLAPTVLYKLAALDEDHRAEVLDRLRHEEDASIEAVDNLIESIAEAFGDCETSDEKRADDEAARAQNKAAGARRRQHRREQSARTSTRSPTEPHNLRRLAKMLELTASNSDGEALSAVRRANEELKRLGMTWTELLLPEHPFDLWRRGRR
jgi:hypothetical protein